MTKTRTMLSMTAIGVAAGILIYGCAPTAPTSFSDCSDCPIMMLIPAGTYMMGSPGSEPFRGLEDQRRVSIASFALSKYEITFAEWDSCIADGGCKGPAPIDEGWGRDSRPVVGVSWDMAQSYVEWLSQKTGKSYRLPSETEWEYAARAGTATPFSFGATITTNQANYDGSTGFADGPAGVNRRQTLAVGSFPANAFGLHDMHGNAQEWMEDCWNDGYTADAPTNSAPYLTPECGEHALRGGSWQSPPGEIRSAARAGMRRDEQLTTVGFRVALNAG
jgi:formylglycine-generating enzyme required for sulfatase activity